MTTHHTPQEAVLFLDCRCEMDSVQLLPAPVGHHVISTHYNTIQGILNIFSGYCDKVPTDPPKWLLTGTGRQWCSAYSLASMDL